MIHTTSIKADIKLIQREPVLMMLTALPLFIFVFIKLMLVFGTPLLMLYTGFDLSPYNAYILATTLLLSPFMLGTVVGFLMIDEKDARIYELISITPVGYSGYILNRLLLPMVGSILYTFVGYLILNIYSLSFALLAYMAVLLGIEGAMLGFLLFYIADDKVKGLTYSKGLGVFMFFVFADLIDIKWIRWLASILPFYWMVRIIRDPNPAFAAGMAAMLHILYFISILRMSKKV